MYGSLQAARTAAHAGRTLATATGAILFAAAAAAAQPALSLDRPLTADPTILLERAETLLATPSGWIEAAVLFQESARMLDEADPLAVWSLRRSAQLLHSTGNPLLAAETLERAGAMALAAGDTAGATTCFLEAAHVAQERGDREALRRLGQTIRVLALVPARP